MIYKEAKKYFYKTLLFIPLVGMIYVTILFGILFYIIPDIETSYSLGHIDKMKLLNKEGKKIVLLGGSNVGFGFNSNLIKEEFNEYTVINAGTRAGFGMRFSLKEISKKLKKDDILIIMPEYNHFSDDSKGYGGIDLLDIIKYRKSIKNITIREIYYCILNIKSYFLNQINSGISNKLYGKIFVYDRRGYNKNGDYIEHYKFPIINNLKGQVIFMKKIDNSILTFFYKEKIKLEKNGVIVFFFPPVLQNSSANLSIKTLKEIEKKMKNNKTPFSDKIENYYLEDKYFYDTIYHLNKEGAKIRTEKVIKKLKVLIDKE
ncbi:hypothetical protein [Fusobacterium perfoetens]|uniref:hypothetical protein n=1 Tax=Fusobacterium perfoetens TaxID=852 RepID=UPI00130E9A01|nr:hypothetical protein [Fusobacterium perfoetens]